MKTFFLISVMLLTSLFIESRTVPDVHIRGTNVLLPQTTDPVQIQSVVTDLGILNTYQMVFVETHQAVPAFSEMVQSTFYGYTDVENPPPLQMHNQAMLNRFRDTWKFLITDLSRISNSNSYSLTTNYHSQNYYNYNRQATVNPYLSLKRYPSTMARRC